MTRKALYGVTFSLLLSGCATLEHLNPGPKTLDLLTLSFDRIFGEKGGIRSLFESISKPGIVYKVFRQELPECDYGMVGIYYGVAVRNESESYLILAQRMMDDPLTVLEYKFSTNEITYVSTNFPENEWDKILEEPRTELSDIATNQAEFINPERYAELDLFLQDAIMEVWDIVDDPDSLYKEPGKECDFE